MLTLLYIGLAAAASISLEKPFQLNGWRASGDYKAGNDILQVGTYPGSTTSLWSEQQISWPEWTFEVTMRTFAGDADPESSGLAFFYTSQILGSGSLHGSSETFDGLAITVDSLGWSEQGDYPDGDKGAVRGHLSDGSVPFGSNPAEQAFSLCRVPYRKTSGPITVRVGYGRGVFITTVNDQLCFSSDKIQLPAGYFGISGNTGSSADGFGIEKAVLTPGFNPELEKHFDAGKLETAKLAYEPHVAGSSSFAGRADTPPATPHVGAPVAAVDLKPILDAVSALGGRIDQMQQNVEHSQKNIKEAIHLADSSNPGLENIVDLVETINHIAARVENIERKVDGVSGSVDGHRDTLSGFGGRFDQLASKVDSHSPSLPQDVLDKLQAPSMWKPVIVLLVGQAFVYIGYMSYIARQTKRQKLL